MAVVATALAAGASAQEWRGLGRLAGKVTDESGKPLEGVTVKATLPAAGGGGRDVTTNDKGEWAVSGIARGGWSLDFLMDGYEPRRISVEVSETSRLPPIEITLKKLAPKADPGKEIRAELEKADALVATQKPAEARTIYEEVLAKYPDVHQVHALIARTHRMEKNYDKAIEHLRLALEKDPDSVELTLLLGNTLVEKGDAEEGRKVLASVDDSKVSDPTTFVNAGIAMLNQNSPKEAMTYFERAVARFPDKPDAYYYRGITHLQLGNTAGAKDDLTKFLAMAPLAPEAEMAKKILGQLK